MKIVDICFKNVGMQDLFIGEWENYDGVKACIWSFIEETYCNWHHVYMVTSHYLGDYDWKVIILYVFSIKRKILAMTF